MGTAYIAFEEDNDWRGSKGVLYLVMTTLHSESVPESYWHRATTRSEVEGALAVAYWDLTSCNSLPLFEELLDTIGRIDAHWSELTAHVRPEILVYLRPEFENLISKVKQRVERLRSSTGHSDDGAR